HPATTEIYTLFLHDALPISVPLLALSQPLRFTVPLVLALDFTASLILGGTNTKKANWAEVKILLPFGMLGACVGAYGLLTLPTTDRKSTRLNSSHLVISYAV